jgi:hypothetical protein
MPSDITGCLWFSFHTLLLLLTFTPSQKQYQLYPFAGDNQAKKERLKVFLKTTFTPPVIPHNPQKLVFHTGK